MAAALSDPRIAGPETGEAGLRVSISHRRAASPAGFELNADFAVGTGVTILFGASGAGKTTLLDCIAGLAEPDRGKIVLGDRVLFDSTSNLNVPARERNIGYVFQDLALFPHLSVSQNVAFGLHHLNATERKQRVTSQLVFLGISHLADRRPAQLSGGERQRVALARALVTRPAVLLLDEPLAALDLPVRMKIADDLRRSVLEHPIPVLYVTHNREEVFSSGEKILVLERGNLIAQGTPHEVLSAPRNETIAQLAGFENIFDVTVGAIHENRGTMTCLLVPSRLELETPLVRAEAGNRLRVGISAGDILLATSHPAGLSARNILRGRVVSLEQRDMIVIARVDCGVEMFVHLTLLARDSLHLGPGKEVWLIVKTHSCHLLAM
jgi:molybdate transport system ATP-binding protein